MTGVPLRIAEPTGTYRRSLRRFTFREQVIDGQPWHPETHRNCPARERGCNATAVVGEVTEAEREEASGDNWPHDDPRWPGACEACGSPFRDSEPWQRNDDPLFRCPDGRVFCVRDFGNRPVGAIFRVPWTDEFYGGEGWMVILPDGGEWITTQTAMDGGKWTVTGTPPLITVSPSIWHGPPGGWHGWIRDGVLEPA